MTCICLQNPNQSPPIMRMKMMKSKDFCLGNWSKHADDFFLSLVPISSHRLKRILCCVVLTHKKVPWCCSAHYVKKCPPSPPESPTRSFRRNLESWGSIYWRAPMTWLLSKCGSSKVGWLLLLMVFSYGVLDSVLRHPVRLNRSTWFLERTVYLMNWEAVERLQFVPFACCSDLSYSCSDF